MKKSLRRPNSIARSHSNRSSRDRSLADEAPLPVTGHNIQRPCLSEGLAPFQFHQKDELLHDQDSNESQNSSTDSLHWMKMPPRTNWTVQDSKLKPIPPLYPPLVPHCCTYVGDASPSTVAARISDCLKRRSILAEFDDEAATASALNAEKVFFVISLFRGGKGPRINLTVDDYITDRKSRDEKVIARPDFSHGVIVECQRVKGDTISFSRDCLAVLMSAKGDSDGLDDQRNVLGGLMRSPFTYGYGFRDISERGKRHDTGFPNLVKLRKKNPSISMRVTFVALENALDFLGKDRLDAQLLGMKSLVLLTDKFSSRLETAFLSSLCVLGIPIPGNSQHNNDFSLFRIYEWVHSLVIRRSPPGAKNDFAENESSSRIGSNRRENSGGSDVVGIDVEHITAMRGLAIRALANALNVVFSHRDQFPPIDKSCYEHLVTDEFMEGIAGDLEGAVRPPLATLGTAHEAAISARCLHLLSGFRATQSYSNSKSGDTTKSILGMLEKARMAGMCSHKILELEAEGAYIALSDEIAK